MRTLVLVVACGLFVGIAGVVCAEDAQPEGDPPRDPFVLDWWTVAGGGGPAAGDEFELLATIGQTDVGVSIGEDYMLQSGCQDLAGSTRHPSGCGTWHPSGVLFVDGSGSGLDADTIDGLDSTSLASSATCRH